MTDRNDNSKVNNNLNRVFNNSIPDTVLYHPEIRLLDLRIYAIIKSFMDTYNTCFPSNRWIAEKTGSYIRSVPRSMEKLERLNFIERVEIKGKRYLVTKQFPTLVNDVVEDTTDPNLSTPHVIQDMGGCHTGHGGDVIQDIHNRSKINRSKNKIDRSSIRSDFNENEQKARELVITKIGDDSFTFEQARKLLSFTTNQGKLVTLQNLEISLDNYIAFLTNNKTGKTVRNKLAYFLKSMKQDGFFCNPNQFTKEKKKPQNEVEKNPSSEHQIKGPLDAQESNNTGKPIDIKAIMEKAFKDHLKSK